MDVWIVSLRTTGEVWHTFVCATAESVVSSLCGHGISRRIAGDDGSEYQTWVSPKDNTQTAGVSRVRLIGYDPEPNSTEVIRAIATEQ